VLRFARLLPVPWLDLNSCHCGGWGFGIGDKHQVLHKFVDPPKPMNVSISEDALANW
jgi:hypothetical protein